MKKAYCDEVGDVEKELSSVKLQLETFYAKRHADKDIVEAVKEEYDSLMSAADRVLNTFAGCMKTVRTAMAV